MARRGGVAARRRRTALGCGAAVLMLLAALTCAFGWLVFGASGSSRDAGTPVQVEVAPGATTRAVAELLASNGVVRNANMFRLKARLAGADGKLKPGVYDLSTGMPDSVVIDRLKEGPPISYVTVTIPEGFTVDQIAARLEKQAGVPADEFLALAKGGAAQFAGDHPYLEDVYKGSLEGYLFPKTYRLREGTSAAQAIEVMLDQFDEEIARVDTTGAEARGLDLAQLVTIASIIERETRVDSERPLVSSVIENRLAKNMNLEIDATIEYVLPGNRFRLSYRDTRIDSPYNTYRYTGIPPGPIANPGLKSLKAAAAPADTDYIYYVLTSKDGTHTFTDNKADFLVAKRKSKEVFGK